MMYMCTYRYITYYMYTHIHWGIYAIHDACVCVYAYVYLHMHIQLYIPMISQIVPSAHTHTQSWKVATELGHYWDISLFTNIKVNSVVLCKIIIQNILR